MDNPPAASVDNEEEQPASNSGEDVERVQEKNPGNYQDPGSAGGSSAAEEPNPTASGVSETSSNPVSSSTENENVTPEESAAEDKSLYETNAISAQPSPASDGSTDATTGSNAVRTAKTDKEKAYDFLRRKDVYVKPESTLPEDSEFALAKAFLMSASTKTETNLYDHLTTTIMRILETRPKDAVDIFESISSEIKRSKFSVEIPGAPNSLKKAFENDKYLKRIREQSILYERIPEDEDKGEDSSGEIPDIMDLANLWEWAGVAFGKEETFTLFLSLKKLVAEKPLKSVRLWGRIQTLSSPYIIVEGELRDSAVDEDEAQANQTSGESALSQTQANESAAETGESISAAENAILQELTAKGHDVEAAQKIAKLFAEESSSNNISKAKNKTIGPLSLEVRTGVNKYVYYVCTYVGGPWTRLPEVIPEKLQAARRIRKYFTGNLNHQVISYPAFEGTEAQYLRCQIARISAATVASPAGYYMFDPEEGENEDGEHSATIIINPEYEGLPNDALLSPSNWVHHVPYVLPQGRTTWENPPTIGGSGNGGGRGDDEDGDGDDGDGSGGEDDDGSGGGEADAEVEPETGPAILSSLAADEDGVPAWVARPCSTLSPPKFCPVVLRSTRWPGAIVVAYNDKFANLYVGDGQRDLTASQGLFVPPPLPEVQKEYIFLGKAENGEEQEDEDGEPKLKEIELKEQRDPTVDEEKAYEELKRQKEAEGKEEEEEEEGGEGNDEEEEED
ncbi:Radial spoke head protein 4 A [Phlyctochytrium bullatum]|nr:Radial spoke head protein 4 A [Phlyctochytrium bullatum]